MSIITQEFFNTGSFRTYCGNYTLTLNSSSDTNSDLQIGEYFFDSQHASYSSHRIDIDETGKYLLRCSGIVITSQNLSTGINASINFSLLKNSTTIKQSYKLWNYGSTSTGAFTNTFDWSSYYLDAVTETHPSSANVASMTIDAMLNVDSIIELSAGDYLKFNVSTTGDNGTNAVDGTFTIRNFKTELIKVV